MVNVERPLLATSNNLLEKPVSIAFQQQRVADGDSLLGQLVRNPSYKFIDFPQLMQLMINGRIIAAQHD